MIAHLKHTLVLDNRFKKLSLEIQNKDSDMKLIKFFLKFFLLLILLIFIIWAIILAVLQTKPGKEWAFHQAITYLERTSQTKLQINNFSLSFPFNLSLNGITISKNDQPILAIQHFELKGSYTQLLQGRLVFSNLQASDIQIINLPSSENSIKEKAISWNTPLLPFYVKLENIDIQRVKIHANLIDSLNLPEKISQIIKQTSLNLNGLISNHPLKSLLTAHLLITGKSDLADFVPFRIGVDAQNQKVSLSFFLNQFPLFILQSQLPSYLKADLSLQAHAPLSTWLELTHQDWILEDQPIEGNVKCVLNASTENPTPLSTLVGQKTTIRSHYLLKSKDIIELLNLKIDNPNFLAVGEAVLTSNLAINYGHFQGELDDLERFQQWIGKDIKGKIDFEGHATGPFLSPLFVLHLKTPQLIMAQQIFKNVHSTIQASPQNKHSNGFFTLSFDYQNIPWKVATSFDWNDQKRLKLSHLQINAMHSYLQGEEITCFLPEFTWDGVLKAHIGNFNDISYFLNTPINGEGQLEARFTTIVDANNRKKQELDVELMGKSLSWMDWKAQQLTIHLQMNPLSAQENNLFQIQSLLEGKHIQWRDYLVEQGTALSFHTIDLMHQSFNHTSTEWKAQHIQWSEGKVAKAEGKIQLQNPLQTTGGQIELTLHQIQTPTIQLEELIGLTTLHSSHSYWPFHLKGKGVWKEDLLFDIEGSWSYQNDKLEMEAQHLVGRFGPYPLQLKKPVHFTQENNKIQLKELWLQWGEAEIQGEFNQNQQNILSHFKTNAVPSELFHFVAPQLPLSGRVTFQGQLEGTNQQPKGQFQIDLHHVQFIEDIFANKPFIAGKLLLTFDEKGLQVKSELNGVGRTPLIIAGQLPFNLSFNPFSYKIDSQANFELSLNAEGELDPYLHLFYNDIANLSGKAQIALKFHGQLGSPKIKGYIDLINGTYESLSTGALYHNIQAHLEADGSKVILTKLFAQDNKNGRISAEGIINLDPIRHFPFEFQIFPSHIFILDSDYADISASGHLTLVGNIKKPKLQGELKVDQANIHLEEALPHQIKNVDIRYINVFQNEKKSTQFEKQDTNIPLELGIKILASERVHIQANHLKSEWKGSINITGTSENPQLHGDLRLSQGEYDFNGKVFSLNQGNIHFAGAAGKKTSLYVVASKEIDRITAEIIVKGPVNKPVISFRSNPPLPQREVLSYILFNRGISDITVDQGEQLSQSFISLQSAEQTKSSDDFLSRLRNNIGIDRLDFTTNDNKENKDFGLQVGKHITENIMVSVNQSMTSLSPIIAIEAQLRKNIKAQAETGVSQDAPVRISIKWKKDY